MLNKSSYSDQTTIFNPSTWSWPVHLVGAGGINNLVGITLAKMGISEIHIWDDDVLEERNLPTEVGYSALMCGEPKVVAMSSLIYYLMPNGVDVYQHPERVTADTELSGVVISGVDSMGSRKIIWENVKKNYLNIPFLLMDVVAAKKLSCSHLVLQTSKLEKIMRLGCLMMLK